jgi:hypothetical protein
MMTYLPTISKPKPLYRLIASRPSVLILRPKTRVIFLFNFHLTRSAVRRTVYPQFFEAKPAVEPGLQLILS